jgi:hypothetical protein
MSKEFDELSNVQIDDIGKKYIPDYRMCVCKDQLPVEYRPGFYVLNSQSSEQGNRQGLHWTSMLCTPDTANEKGIIYYMDCMGMPPFVSVEEYADGRKIIYNGIDFEAFKSNQCGWYCIYFGMHTGDNIGFKKMNETFDADVQKNERILREWRRKMKFP